MSEYIMEYLPDTTCMEREEIVRCRDCKHYTEDEAEYWHYCGEWCGQVEPDGFCKWASRRES